MNYKTLLALQIAFLCVLLTRANDAGKDEFDDGDEVTVEEEVDSPSVDVYYESPAINKEDHNKVYLAEHFDDPVAVSKKWIRSKATKEGVSEDIAKYNGEWKVEGAIKDSLPSDLGLVLKSKAAHAAISASLIRPFVFDRKPLIVQYEVILQDGQECGGAYLKLLSKPKNPINLEQFTDKTPYTIMFGPDKCGNDHKLHFIFKHRNPLNGSVEEKHCKKPKDRLEETYKDKMPHLYTLIINPDNTFEVRIDKSEVNSGTLLDDFTPPVNPPAEIDDPADKKPEDWDERERVPDPDAKKPDDWDESAPSEIPDESAEKPDGWLDNEEEMVPDPDARKPEDWDVEMDGEWEAPLIDNPKCKTAPGCGEWKPPMIPNPDYRGIWRAPMIDNPNYKGKWRPRKIPNPDFFEDKNPFRSLDAISAIGFEIWSMSKDIFFDNLIITDEITIAEEWAAVTFDLKKQKIAKEGESVFMRLLSYAEENPYMWPVYVVVLSLPVILIIVLCCRSSSSSQSTEQDELRRKSAERKKTDAMTEDDPVFEEKGEEETRDDGSDKEKISDNEDEEEEEEEEAEQEDVQDIPVASQSEGDVPRKRRVRKE